MSDPKRKKYLYHYQDVAYSALNEVPEHIEIFQSKPFDNNLFNKYYLMMCRALHPMTNIVCVNNGAKLIAINSKQTMKIYLGGISDATFKRFICEAMEINIIFIIQARNDRYYYLINPAYAACKNLSYKQLFEVFAVISDFSRTMDLSGIVDGKGKLVNKDEEE